MYFNPYRSNRRFGSSSCIYWRLFFMYLETTSFFFSCAVTYFMLQNKISQDRFIGCFVKVLNDNNVQVLYNFQS